MTDDRTDDTTEGSASEPVDGAAAAERVVAIDGPSGSGKSTVAQRLAEHLGYRYLDTGAMYRAVTWHFLCQQIDFDVSGLHLAKVLEDLELELLDGDRVVVNGVDVTAHLRSREVESRVSIVSAMPEVRRKMRGLQRAIAVAGPIVAEGRDMATVVFPRARWKFFLDAAPAERARRRCADFRARGREVTPAEVREEIEVRDSLDSNREDAPLLRTPAAIYVDTTHMDLDEVVRTLAAEVVGDGA